MTREEAIALFEKQLTAAQVVLDSGFGSNPGENDFLYRRRKEMAEIALSALRPVSREQVEEVYPACDVCGGGKEIRSDNFCGMARLRIVGDSINLRGDEKKIKFLGHIYAPSFSVNFCPFCGKPLTDKAVDIIMERLEALKDGKD